MSVCVCVCVWWGDQAGGRGECRVLFVSSSVKSLLCMRSLVVRDGQAAEDGEAAGGVQRGGL